MACVHIVRLVEAQWDKVSGHEYVHQNVVTGYSTLSWQLDILSTVFSLHGIQVILELALSFLISR